MKADFQVFPAYQNGSMEQPGLQSLLIFSFGGWYQPLRSGFGMLKAFNDHSMAPGAALDLIPLDNLEVVFIPVDGSLGYRDSLGKQKIIPQGEMLVLNSGTGIFYSIFNPDFFSSVRFLQLYILPHKRNLPPDSCQIFLRAENQKGKFDEIISAGSWEKKLLIRQRISLFLGDFNQDQQPCIPAADQDTGLFLFLISGEISIFGKDINSADAVGIRNCTSNRLEIRKDSRILLMQVAMNQNMKENH